MNKLRFTLVLLLTACFLQQANAQNVLYSTYDKFDLQSGDFSVVGMVGGRLFTYRATSEGYFLDAYNDSMTKTATVLLDFFPDKIYQTKFIAYPDKIIVLYQALEGNKVLQYAALLDDSGRLKKNPIKLDEARTGLLGATRTYFSSAISEDKKFIIVYSAEDKRGDIDFNGKWIDDQLTIVKRSHAAYSGDNNVTNGEVNIANDGTLYMSAISTVGVQNYAEQLLLLSLPLGAVKFTATEFPLEDHYATNAYIKVDNVNRRIYVGGFYSEKKNGNYDGIIYAYYDIASASFQNKKMLPVDQQLLEASGARNKKRAFDNFMVKQLIIKNDGGFVMVAESFQVITRSNYSPGFGYYSMYYNPYAPATVREYRYEDILALSYDKDGNRLWGAIVPKEQYSQEDGGLFSSYALLNTGGALAFMFNDFNSKQSRIQLATLSTDGKLSMNSFTAEGNDSPDWLPRNGKQVAGRVIVVPCLHKKQLCFARVSF